MMVIKIKNIDLKNLAREIKKGRVIVCPTDTVYGLLADATNKKAVEKIFKIKKRPKTKPLPIFIKDLETTKRLAIIDKNQERFLKKAWPGKITAVLKRKAANRKQKIYGIDKKTIALRISKYKLVLELLKAINKPLTGTSANISGKPATTKIKDILRQFQNKKFQPDLILNTGNLKSSKPSKVIDFTGKRPKILRD